MRHVRAAMLALVAMLAALYILGGCSAIDFVFGKSEPGQDYWRR